MFLKTAGPKVPSLLAMTSILMTGTIALAVESLPPLPSSGLKPADLVRKPWTLVSEAVGDLNNDGKPDAAVVAALKDKDGVAVGSKLVVALRGPDGRLKVAASSGTATMSACGPSGGEPSVEINKGVLTVGHYCGARERYQFNHKYQWRQNKWLLIGYTGDTYDSTAPDVSQNIDINLVTGEVEAGMTLPNSKTSERFLEIRSASIGNAQPAITDWSVPRIVIRPKTKDSPAIAIQALHNKKLLFIKVQCDPPTELIKPDQIALLDAKGKVVPATKKESSPYGYALLTYDLTAPPISKSSAHVEEWSALNPPRLLRLTLAVKDKSGDATTARKSTGAILLSNAKEPLTLNNIDVAEGPLVHPFIFKLPN